MEERLPRPRLYRQLNEYCRSDVYPFHMPGHKRRTKAGFTAEFPNPYSIDITEIDGFDNLHHAEGVLLESMDWAASVYGAGHTYYLVNGSTCGVLAAICAAVPRGGTILLARNSHKAAYHAAALNELNIRYIYPQIIEDFGLQGGLLLQNIEKMLINADDLPAAVFITSPTYDGVVSDVRGIAGVCHRHGIPLIVDEAHGAHFPFGEMFPASALELGADIVIQSLHKTLPAFTQTALLHVQGSLVDTDRLKYFLQVFQTSSPSYVLMAGIERCIEYMAGDGRDEMRYFAARLTDLRGRLRKLRCLRLLDRDAVGSAGIYDLDTSKLVISTKYTGTLPRKNIGASVSGVNAGNARLPAGGTWLTGAELAELLRHDYHMEMEMSGADYITAITTLMDSREGFDRLETALFSIDEKLASGPAALDAAEPASASAALDTAETAFASANLDSAKRPPAPGVHCSAALPRPQALLPIHEAQERPAQALPLESAAGSISGEYVYLYPPGTPVVVPGEVLTEEIVDTIRNYRAQQLPIQGMRDRSAVTLRVLA